LKTVCGTDWDRLGPMGPIGTDWSGSKDGQIRTLARKDGQIRTLARKDGQIRTLWDRWDRLGPIENNLSHVI
jgi:hypothetical protein